MNHQQIIEETIRFVKRTLEDAEGGHDWFHIERVWKMARFIATKEGGDLMIIELAALLHDIADSKFNDGNEEIGPELAGKFMTDQGLDTDTRDHVVSIIRGISFKGGHNTSETDSLEFKIVQDADRLDALGAIGIARAFNYGGYKNRALYDPSVSPNLNMSKAEYKKSTAPTLNHFYEKLFLLKDLMNTASGKEIAKERHHYMEGFVKEFLDEFNARK